MYLTLAQANKLAARYFREGKAPAIQCIRGGYRHHDYLVSTTESRARDLLISIIFPAQSRAGD